MQKTITTIAVALAAITSASFAGDRADIFHLQDVCAERAENWRDSTQKLEIEWLLAEGKPASEASLIIVDSHFNTKDNHCYIRIQWSKMSNDSTVFLKDGQTGDILAFFEIKGIKVWGSISEPRRGVPESALPKEVPFDTKNPSGEQVLYENGQYERAQAYISYLMEETSR